MAEAHDRRTRNRRHPVREESTDAVMFKAIGYSVVLIGLGILLAVLIRLLEGVL